MSPAQDETQGAFISLDQQGRANKVNQLDTKTSVGMQWMDFGSDMTAMFIVAAVAAVGLGIFFMTRRNIE